MTLGPAEGGLVAVSGLREGNRVIVGNLQTIGPGAPVKPPATPAGQKAAAK